MLQTDICIISNICNILLAKIIQEDEISLNKYHLKLFTHFTALKNRKKNRCMLQADICNISRTRKSFGICSFCFIYIYILCIYVYILYEYISLFFALQKRRGVMDSQPENPTAIRGPSVRSCTSQHHGSPPNFAAILH